MTRNREKTSEPSKPTSDVAVKADPASQVLKWIVDGATDTDIRDAIRVNWPDLEAEAVILDAARALEQAAQAPIDLVIGWSMSATREAYRKMVEIGDFPGAVRAAKQVAELALGREEVKRPKDGTKSTKGVIEEMMEDPDVRRLLRESSDYEPPMLNVAKPTEGTG